MDGWITIGTELDTKQFDAQILALEREINEIEQDMNSGTMSGREFEEASVKVEKLKNKLISLKAQQDKINYKGFEKATISTHTFGKGIESNIKKIGKLALGIFGLRSAYMAVRQASSTLGQYDEQYASNLEYIRWALVQGIAPVLKYIVNLAMQALQYLNYILNAWFGINLFANASAKKFASMSKSAASTAKSAKEIKKQLAGFDEMTVLGDSNTETLGGGIGNTLLPGIDLASMQGEIPSWIKWIADNKDIVLSFLATAGVLIGALKLAELITYLGSIFRLYY